MVTAEGFNKINCTERKANTEAEVFGLLAPQVAGKNESELMALCDRLEVFIEDRRAVA